MLSSPAPASDAPSLVLFHGLGFSGAVWEGLAEDLQRSFHLHIFDLPGFGQSAPPSPDSPPQALLDSMLLHLPPRACYLGWSLGGHLALQLAMRFPKRVEALITIGTSPCFQQRPGWTAGVSEEDLLNFRQIVAEGQKEGMRRLASLIARGEGEPLGVVRCLERLTAAYPPSSEGMRAGLRLLAEGDLREGLQALQMPMLHILGGGDALVPAALARALQTLCPAHRVMVLPGTGHAPFLTFPSAVAAGVRCFAEDNGLLPSSPQPLDQHRIARSFSRAAKAYDQVADLQRESGEILLSHVIAESSPGRRAAVPFSFSDAPQLVQQESTAADPGRDIGSEHGAGPLRLLDLGCGTGHFLPMLKDAFPEGQCLALDLAEGMLRQAQSRADAAWLCADAARLPLAAGTLHLIFANLVFQWCGPPGPLLKEMARVLRSGGCLAFATFGPETLWELRTAWRAADADSHVRRFALADDWRRAASAADMGCEMLQTSMRLRRYPDLRGLAAELKSLGAHNSAPRVRGLTAPRRLAIAEAAYETLRDEAGLPATFQLIFGLLVKR